MTSPRLSLVRLTSPLPDATPAPLLLVGPSLGTSVETLWAPTAALLDGRVEVIGWDLPGHGDSPAPDGPFTVADLAAGVADVLRKLRDDRPADVTVAYAGVSVGGATGLEVGVNHPGAADGIVVVCSGAALGTPDGWRERAAAVRADGTASMVEGSRGRWFAPGWADAHPELATALLDSLVDADDEGYAATCEALASYDVRADLGRITDPLLTINGEADQVAPPELGRAVADGVAAGRAIALPGVAHLAPSEDPAATADALLRFVTALPQGWHGQAAEPTPADGSEPDTRAQIHEAGMAVRREVLGDAHVDRANAKIDDFTAEFQDLITRYAWGTIWTRPGLDRVTRSAITLTALIGGGHHDELAMHVRAAMRNGMTRDQLREVLLQSAIYCSVPSANSAFRIAQETLAQLDAETPEPNQPQTTPTPPTQARPGDRP
ncbi:bifunctional 3-oxoadipate enol-lactonase/4-carboxymuconolactone decarboxylase PcaDC [Agilicoccus flavus]|uniref:bifunctional 3-oxoadipate enol-lactonase/4-carboxymuconolactone decarboxylase PcaDC n=1 Tax=Agilicoccus flavus TaxID=2775968 RepID=UPI003FD77F60